MTAQKADFMFMPKFDMTAPCPFCPFRCDNEGFLGRARAEEIMESVLVRGEPFHCHKTLHYGEHDRPDQPEEDSQEWGIFASERSQFCAGLRAVFERLGEESGWMQAASRMAHGDRLKYVELDRNLPVFDTWEAFVRAHSDDEELSSHERRLGLILRCEASRRRIE